MAISNEQAMSAVTSTSNLHLPEDSQWLDAPWQDPPADDDLDITEKPHCFCCEESEDEIDLVKLDCGDHYLCPDCMRTAIQAAVSEETYYPVPCYDRDVCGTTSDDTIESFLSGDSGHDSILLAWWHDKIEEYSTPAAFRTYCANVSCQAAQGSAGFLDADVLGDDAFVLCPDCSCVTRRKCKDLVLPDTQHECKPDEHNDKVHAYIETLPEDDQWLWQQCPHCTSWTEKIQNCNHMTCRCGGQFCLCCGRKWTGLTSCSYGCPHYEKPVYDEEGYMKTGFHRDTGLDREGLLWDANLEHEDDQYGYQYDDDDDDDDGYDLDGFDKWGFNREGYDRDGYNSDGWDRAGRDREGFDWRGYNEAGFDRQGFDDKMMNAEGLFNDGHDFEGFDVLGYSFNHLHRLLYKDDGYDLVYDRDASGYSRAGFDKHGYDLDGYDAEGYDQEGFSARGIDREGYNRAGFDRHHKSRQNEPARGFYLAPDGNMRRIVEHEGPDRLADFMSCPAPHARHNATYRGGSTVCYICRWDTDYFYYRCTECEAPLCRACSRDEIASANEVLRRRYMYPGNDSYGIKEIIEALEEVSHHTQP